MLTDFLSKLHNLDQLVAWAGYVGLTVIVFCETGLLVGFFLPGDSLLVTAGFVASQGGLRIWPLVALLGAAAVIGDSTGYLIGHFAGPRLFVREDSFFFRREHVDRTHRFFERYGGKTIILARFVPIVRTFAPTVAGVGKMDYRKFLVYNAVGGVSWVIGMLSVGYFLGRSVPGVRQHIDVVILVVIAVSFLPIVIEWIRAKKNKTSS